MISHLNQYIIDEMVRRYKLVCIFNMHGEVYIFGIKVISRLIGMTYENIAKMANKMFNVPNHLKCTIRSSAVNGIILLISNAYHYIGYKYHLHIRFKLKKRPKWLPTFCYQQILYHTSLFCFMQG